MPSSRFLASDVHGSPPYEPNLRVAPLAQSSIRTTSSNPRSIVPSPLMAARATSGYWSRELLLTEQHPILQWMTERLLMQLGRGEAPLSPQQRQAIWREAVDLIMELERRDETTDQEDGPQVEETILIRPDPDRMERQPHHGSALRTGGRRPRRGEAPLR